MIRLLPNIQNALNDGAPIVALESSVIAQGLPIPQNREAVTRMVAAVERGGAIAAITAVVAGRPAVGLESDELDRFLQRDKSADHCRQLHQYRRLHVPAERE